MKDRTSEKKLHLKPCLIVIAGMALAGKTTLGNRLAKDSDVTFLDVDTARQEFAPGTEWLGAIKEKEIMSRAYRLNHQKAQALLESGGAVVMAATYSRENYHEMVRTLIETVKVPTAIFLLKISQEESLSRLKKRDKSPSNIYSLESYLELSKRYIPIDGKDVIALDGKASPEELAMKIFNILRTRNLC